MNFGDIVRKIVQPPSSTNNYECSNAKCNYETFILEANKIEIPPCPKCGSSMKRK